MATTRLGLYGGPRAPYGSFANKTIEDVVAPIVDAVQFGKKFYAEQYAKQRRLLSIQMRQEDEEILTIIQIIGKFLL